MREPDSIQGNMKGIGTILYVAASNKWLLFVTHTHTHTPFSLA